MHKFKVIMYTDELWEKYCKDSYATKTDMEFIEWLVRTVYNKNERIKKLEEHIETHAEIRTN